MNACEAYNYAINVGRFPAARGLGLLGVAAPEEM
jgi:hypothetical protein